MKAQERLDRRYLDLLTPERMREGVAYEAMVVQTRGEDPEDRAFGYAEVYRPQGLQDRFVRVVPVRPSWKSGEQDEYDLHPVSSGRLVSVVLVAGAIAELARRPARAGDLEVSSRSVSVHSRGQAVENLPAPRRELGRVRAVQDLEGYDERPEPLQATSAGEFLQALREYRAWAGSPSLRAMSEGCGKRVSHSTFANALNAGCLPKLVVVQALIEGCGGRGEDVQRWTTAWRRLSKRLHNQDSAASKGAPTEFSNLVFTFEESMPAR